MALVVPAEELAAERAGLLDRVNRAGNPGRYFKVLKCASEYGLSVEVYGRRVGLGDAEVGSRNATGLERHRAAAVGVDRELPAGDLLLGRASR